MQRITEDSTDAIAAYPPTDLLLEHGAPSSPHVRVGTPSTALPDEDSWEAAAVDGVSASTNADAAAGATSLSFAGDPGVTAWRRYLLELSTGERLIVTPTGTGTTVTLSDPLPYAVASGATLTGIAITHALTADETESRGDGLVKLKATIGEVVRFWDEALRVEPARVAMLLTPGALLEAEPQVRDLLRRTDDDAREALFAAWQHEMLPRLRAAGVPEDNIDSPEELVAPHAAAVVFRLTRQAAPGNIELREAALQDFDRAFDRAMRSREMRIATPGTDATAPTDNGAYTYLEFGR